MTKAEIAAHLKCTPRYINTLMRRGILPYLKTRGLLRFDPEDCSQALKVFKTRSRFALEKQPTAASPCVIAPGTFGGPLAMNRSLTGAAQDSSATSHPEQNICAKVFESTEAARQYLEEKALDAPGGHTKASITVIILQSTPVL